jgi:carbamoyl-phosphate synthase large subunit
MKSVGEAMAIGRTFKESLQKALRSLEIGRFGLGADGKDREPRNNAGGWDVEEIQRKLVNASWDRIFYIRYALLAGFTISRLHELTNIDPWFLENIRQIDEEQNIASGSYNLRRAKQFGFSDRQLAYLTKSTESDLRSKRIKEGVLPTYRLVDTCAEFEAYTNYYSTYGDEDETSLGDRQKIMILGGGPNRIVKELSSTTVACTSRLLWKEKVSKRSWSIRIRKRFRPITTPATNFISSHRGGC